MPPAVVLPCARPRGAAPAAARGSGRPVLASPRLVCARDRCGHVRPPPTPRSPAPVYCSRLAPPASRLLPSAARRPASIAEPPRPSLLRLHAPLRPPPLDLCPRCRPAPPGSGTHSRRPLPRPQPPGRAPPTPCGFAHAQAPVARCPLTCEGPWGHRHVGPTPPQNVCKKKKTNKTNKKYNKINK